MPRSAEAARHEWRAVADRLRERFRKLAELMDEAEDDVLAHMAFPKEHWQQLHSTNPLERLILARSERHTPSYVVVPEELLSHIARVATPARGHRLWGLWHLPLDVLTLCVA